MVGEAEGGQPICQGGLNQFGWHCQAFLEGIGRVYGKRNVHLFNPTASCPISRLFPPHITEAFTKFEGRAIPTANRRPWAGKKLWANFGIRIKYDGKSPLQEVGNMKQVTRDIDPDSAQDLLKRVPRVCMAFADEDWPQATPIAFVWQKGCYLAGIPELKR